MDGYQIHALANGRFASLDAFSRPHGGVCEHTQNIPLCQSDLGNVSVLNNTINRIQYIYLKRQTIYTFYIHDYRSNNKSLCNYRNGDKSFRSFNPNGPSASVLRIHLASHWSNSVCLSLPFFGTWILCKPANCKRSGLPLWHYICAPFPVLREYICSLIRLNKGRIIFPM